MISAVAWVPRGCAMENPIKFEPTEEELELARTEAEMSEMAIDSTGNEGEGASADGEMAGSSDVTGAKANEETSPPKVPPAPSTSGVDATGLPEDLRMDAYDDEDEDEDMSFARGMMEGGDLPDISEEGGENGADIPSDEEEDTQIKPTDAILLAAHAEDEYSCLEVYLYDEGEGSLFVHHDIALPAFPLALAWMGHPPGASIAPQGTSAAEMPSGNFVAVGTFEPGIEIWNLDILEALTPTATLGGRETAAETKARLGSSGGSKKKKKKKGKRSKSAGLLPELRPGSHKDAVLALSWNPMQR